MSTTPFPSQSIPPQYRQLFENELLDGYLGSLEIGYWFHAPGDPYLRCSAGLRRMLGFDETQFTVDLEALGQKFLPDDLERLIQLRQYFRNPSELVESQLFQYRLLIDGKIRYMRTQVVPLPESPDRPARLFGITQDVTDLRVAEQNLQTTERRFQLFFDSAPSAIFLMDGQLRMTYVNDRALSLFGYTRDELLGRDLIRMLVPSNEQNTKLGHELRERLSNPAVPRFGDINYNLTKDGRRLCLSWTNRSLFDENGKLKEVLCIGNDLTKLLEAQAAVIQSESRFHNLVETTESAVLLLGSDLKITYANSFAERWLGYRPGELNGLSAIDSLIDETDDEGNRQREIVRARYANKTVFSFRSIHRNIRKDGSVAWGAWSRLINRDKNGDIIDVFCLGNDITELKEIQSRFDLAVEQAGLGFWEYNVSGNKTIYSDQWYQIRGIRRLGDKEANYPLWEQSIHVEDLPGFLSSLRMVVEGDAPFFMTHFRTLNPTRGWTWIRSTGMVTRRDAQGKPTWITGFDQNWTQEIVHEQELRKNRDLLERTMVIGRMGYWTYDIASKSFSSLHTALRNILGPMGPENPREDFLEVLQDLLHPDDKKRAMAYFTDRLDIEKNDVFRFLTRDGSYAHVDASSIPDFNASRQLVRRVGVFHDISEQKRSEAIIRERELALLSVLAVSQAGTWQLDPLSEEVEVSDEIASILHAGTIGRIKVRDFIRQWVHPDDQILMWENFLLLLTETGRFELECRMVDRHGHIKYTKQNALAIQNDGGQIQKVIGIILDITRRVERENEINESKQRYQTLFDRSNDAVTLLEQGRFVEVNYRTQELFGVQDHEMLLQMYPWELAPEFQPNGERSKDMLSRIMNEAIDSSIPRQCDWRARKLSGAEFDTLVSFSQVPYAGHHLQLMVLRDMTDQKNAAKMFENYRAYLSVLAEMRKMFYGRNEEEIIQAFLVNMSHHFGFSKVWYGEIVDRSLIPAYHAGSMRLHKDVERLSLDVRPDEIPFPLIRALQDNVPRTLDSLDRNEEFAPWADFVSRSRVRGLFAIPFEVDEKQEGGIVLYSSESDTFDSAMIDYLQNVIRELSRIVSEKRFWENQKLVLRRAKEKAEIATQAKSRFLANMSHEIRTPMTAIVGYTEMIADPSMTHEGRQEALFVIRNNAEYLLQILNDVLDFSKIEADKLKIEVRQVAVVPILDEVAMLYTNKAREKNLSLTISNTTPFPDTIFTDSVRLKQVLLNLVSNAVKFTSQGGIRLILGWEKGAGSATKGTLRIAVSDTGIGIAPETFESLFSAFHQADSSTTRRFGGTGLGLAISKRLVQMLGGDILTESELGKGTTFTIVLPQELSSDAEWLDRIEDARIPDNEIIVKSAQTDTTRLPLQGYRLLLAEDGKDNQRLFNLILSKAGADVTAVENGQQAFDLAMQSWQDGHPFDLIVMDMQMPVMDGYTAVRKLRETGYAAPIIALTAHAMLEEKKRCLAVGCNDYATKPILRESLIEVVLKNVKKQ